MKKILVLLCSCGEEVYENDYGSDWTDGKLYCVNCNLSYTKEDLKEVDIPEIKEL